MCQFVPFLCIALGMCATHCVESMKRHVLEFLGYPGET